MNGLSFTFYFLITVVALWNPNIQLSFSFFSFFASICTHILPSLFDRTISFRLYTAKIHKHRYCISKSEADGEFKKAPWQ